MWGLPELPSTALALAEPRGDAGMKMQPKHHSRRCR